MGIGTQHIQRPAALTWGRNRPAARRGQRRTGDNAACRVRGPIREGPHSVAGPLVIHSHTAGEGVAHAAVGLPVVATDLLRFPAHLLRTEQTTAEVSLRSEVSADQCVAT